MIGKEKSAPAAEIFPELTRDVIARMDRAQSARLREVMEIVIRHLHAIVREAMITQGESAQAIDFLTRRQDVLRKPPGVILLSDILGISMLVDAVDNVAGPGITDSTVLGPFYAGQQRELAQGDSILLREEAGEPPLVMSGRVTDPEGQPVAGALIEIWQTAPNQLYDVQDKDQPEAHLRASFRADAAGLYRFQKILPVSYPIPDDGPAGQLVTARGRHPFRPAHVHFMISAPGYRTLVTHLFFEGDNIWEATRFLE